MKIKKHNCNFAEVEARKLILWNNNIKIYELCMSVTHPKILAHQQNTQIYSITIKFSHILYFANFYSFKNILNVVSRLHSKT